MGHFRVVTAFLLCAPAAVFASVNVSSPASGAAVGSPVRYVATATSTCAQGIASMGIYINNKLTYVVDGASLDTNLSFSAGSYNTVVEEWDRCGGASYTPVNITVGSPTGVTISSPADDSTVGSPVKFVATASAGSCAKGVAAMGIYVNNQLKYTGNGATLNTSIALSPGSYSAVVEEWDNCGGASYAPLEMKVVNQTGVYVSEPVAHATVPSPVTYVASASTTACAQGVASMGIYVNNKLTYVTNGSQLNTQLALGQGAQHTVVEEWDSCGGASYTTIDLTVSGTKTMTGIAVTPDPGSVPAGASIQFKATATYSDGSAADITSTADWELENAAVATLGNAGSATADAAGSTTVTAIKDGVNGTAQMNVTLPSAQSVNIPTWHADNNRTGLNSHEVTLKPANVTPSTFGKLFSVLVDGYAYGEPLLVSNVTVNGAKHNVLYVATEKDSVYAFDADVYGAPLWKVSLLRSGESPITNGAILPYLGVTSTPVIDTTTNTMYVVSTQASTTAPATFRLNALDVTTGAQKFGGPVTINASVPGTNSDAVNGMVTLNTTCIQRAALLLANNSVHMGFGGCHSGWLVAYNAQTLAQTGVFNASPNANGEGQFLGAGGIWMGSGGPAADAGGNVYATTGNGPWDGKTAFGDTVLKFNAALQVEDYFTPFDYQYMNCADKDLAAGGIMLIPGTSLALAGGKSGKLYLLNTANMGKEQTSDAGAVQTLWYEGDISAPYSNSCTDSSGTNTTQISSYQVFGTAAYFNNSTYLGVSPTVSGVPAGIRQFTLSGNTLTPGTYTLPSIQMYTRGTTPFMTANGTSSGVMWMIDTGQPLQNGGPSAPSYSILRAYDATNLSNELYNSEVNPGDRPGYGIKFSSPVVGNGKVYISTGHDLTTVTNPQGEIDVYGLN
jgi:uncharacterized cupredoxin-like copper-binding protein